MVPEHPGVWIADVLVPSLKQGGVSATRFAELLGISRQTLYDLLGGRAPLTPNIATRLVPLFGQTFAEAAVCQQARHDLALQVGRRRDEFVGLPDLRALPLAPPIEWPHAAKAA